MLNLDILIEIGFCFDVRFLLDLIFLFLFDLLYVGGIFLFMIEMILVLSFYLLMFGIFIFLAEFLKFTYDFLVCLLIQNYLFVRYLKLYSFIFVESKMSCFIFKSNLLALLTHLYLITLDY